MAKRKANKKSPSSSSRPPPSRPALPLDEVILGLPSPTKKHARHSSLHPPPHSLALVLTPKKLKGPIQVFSPELGATGTAPGCVDHPQQIAPPQPPSPKIPATVSSPKLALSPVELSSAEDSEDEDTSSCHSDSSSHYGSTDLATSKHIARQPSPASSAPVDSEEVPATSPPAKADVGRNVQVSAGAGTLPTFAAIASPLVDAGLQDPMVCEAATDWEPVPKKLISNRQPKMKAIGSGPAEGSALGKVSAAAKGKSVEAAGIGSVDTGLMASGSVSAGSTKGMDCEVLKGKSKGLFRMLQLQLI
ncbi:hypothetical protein OIU85_007410 [Salix viminalis]|uniref:Uncharacterized protein n=1 Tax=Salix viminalis TaxID=40686 RepID=A0A9Q0P9I2_SALVM|nr:hypothetical protein OIU85_007410 [Salix viminalis]